MKYGRSQAYSVLMIAAGGCGEFKPADILAESATAALTALAEQRFADALTTEESAFELMVATWASEPMIVELAGDRPAFDIVLSSRTVVDRAILRLMVEDRNATVTLGIAGSRVSVIEPFFTEATVDAILGLFPEDTNALEGVAAELTLVFPDASRAILRVKGTLVLIR